MTLSKRGWVYLDVTSAVSQWATNTDLNLGLEVWIESAHSGRHGVRWARKTKFVRSNSDSTAKLPELVIRFEQSHKNTLDTMGWFLHFSTTPAQIGVCWLSNKYTNNQLYIKGLIKQVNIIMMTQNVFTGPVLSKTLFCTLLEGTVFSRLLWVRVDEFVEATVEGTGLYCTKVVT